MKKIFCFMMAVVMMFSVSLCYATEEGTTEEEDNNSTEIDNFDDFDSVVNGGLTQAELQSYYQQYMMMMENQYENYERTNTVKARVINADDIETVYTMDYYNVYQVRYQSLEIEILEGEYKGKVLDTDYILTGDNFGNIEIPMAKKGDKILVAVEEDENGELNAYTISFDTSVSRSGWIIGIVIVVLVIVCIYAGVKGIQTILLVALMITLLLGIVTPEALLGTNILLLGCISILAITAVTVINKLGLRKTTVYAFVGTTIIVLATGLLLYGIDALIMHSGYTLEVTYLSESIVNKNIDFHALYVISTLAITAVLVSDIFAKAFVLEKDAETTADLLKALKETLADKIKIIAIFVIALSMPKLLTLLGAYKYTLHETINSEMFMSEMMRMVVLFLSVTLAVPASAVTAKMKKNKPKLLEAQENNTEQE